MLLMLMFLLIGLHSPKGFNFQIFKPAYRLQRGRSSNFQINLALMTSKTPQYQQYSFENTLHISPIEAFELIKCDKAVLLDVREDYETTQGRPDLSRNMLAIPMSVLLENIDLIPRDKALIVMCAHGIRSVQVVAYLSPFLPEACYNLDGAFEYWELQGLPVISGNVSEKG